MTHIGHSGKVLLMKRLFLIFILTFSLQSWTKADDIRDFQIEGMSNGDSLLDYYSESKIKRVFFESKNGSNYLQYNFHYINDQSYEIVNVKGIMLMENKNKECNSKKRNSRLV